MNDVASDQERNAEPAFLHRDLLQSVDRLYVDLIEYRADTTVPQLIGKCFQIVVITRVALTHLADLLGQRHAVEQCLHTLLDLCHIHRCRCHSHVHSHYR